MVIVLLFAAVAGKSRDRVRAVIGSMYHGAASDTPPDRRPDDSRGSPL